MKIKHTVPMMISCKRMHEHWWDQVELEYDSAAPLEFTMTLRDRVDGNSDPMEDITWILPRAEFADALIYDVPGVLSPVGYATVKIRTSKPNIVVICVPYRDVSDGGKNHPQYLMFKISKLKVFLADVERLVPQSCESMALNVDRLVGRLLYS